MLDTYGIIEVLRLITGASYLTLLTPCYTIRKPALSARDESQQPSRQAAAGFCVSSEAMMNKQCRRCGIWKPSEDFRKASNRPDGLYSYCKACHNAESRLYKQRNKEKIRQKSAEYNERNRERVQAQKANYRRRNADKIRAYHQGRYQKQKETINARNLAWYQQNKGRARRNGLSWRRRNPAKAAAIMHRRRTRKYGNGGSYTATEWATLCQHYGNRCLCCGGEGRLTPDHVLPLAMGGSNDISNIQPLCLTCNIAKGARHIDYRYS